MQLANERVKKRKKIDWIAIGKEMGRVPKDCNGKHEKTLAANRRKGAGVGG